MENSPAGENDHVGAESLPMPLPQRLDKKYEMMKNEMSHYDTAITAIAFTTFVLF